MATLNTAERNPICAVRSHSLLHFNCFRSCSVLRLSLTDWTFFLHLNARQLNLELFNSLFLAAVQGTLGGPEDASTLQYIPLSHRFSCSHFVDFQRNYNIFQDVFHSSSSPDLPLQGYCCGQFLVSKSRILLHPHALYRRALAVREHLHLSQFPSGHSSTANRDVQNRNLDRCRVFFWPLIFGDLLQRANDTITAVISTLDGNSCAKHYFRHDRGRAGRHGYILDGHKGRQYCFLQQRLLSLSNGTKDDVDSMLDIRGGFEKCQVRGSSCAGIICQNSKSEYNRCELLEALPTSTFGNNIVFEKVCTPFKLIHNSTSDNCNFLSLPRFKKDLQDFYENSQISPYLTANYACMLTLYGTVVRECTVAALHLLLLKLEEVAYMSPFTNFNGISSEFVFRARSVMNLNDHWWLEEGVKRVQNITFSRRPSSSVDVVIAFCGVPWHKPSENSGANSTDELTWLFGLVQKLNQVEGLTAYQREHEMFLRLFVVEKCRHKALKNSFFKDYMNRYHRQIVEKFTNPKTSFDFVSVIEITESVRADDCTAYTAHMALVRGALQLPGVEFLRNSSGSQGPLNPPADFTFYLHSDVEEHIIPDLDILTFSFVSAALGTLSPDKMRFMYFSHNLLDLGRPQEWTWESFASERLWKYLFESSVAPLRTQLSGYCCSQFMVSRPAFLLHPPRKFTRMYEYWVKMESYTSLFPVGRLVTWYDRTCRTPCQLNMPWWHVWFGEALQTLRRWNDTRLPLFVRWRSIITNKDITLASGGMLDLSKFHEELQIMRLYR